MCNSSSGLLMSLHSRHQTELHLLKLSLKEPLLGCLTFTCLGTYYWFTDSPCRPLHMITYLYNMAKEQSLPKVFQEKPIKKRNMTWPPKGIFSLLLYCIRRTQTYLDTVWEKTTEYLRVRRQLSEDPLRNLP